MALKKKDYQISKRKQTIDFQRPMNINGKDKMIVVSVNLNHKKGQFDISFKWQYDKMPENLVENKSLLDTIRDLMAEAQAYGRNWEKEWLKNNSDGTIPMFTDNGDANVVGKKETTSYKGTPIPPAPKDDGNSGMNDEDKPKAKTTRKAKAKAAAA